VRDRHHGDSLGTIARNHGISRTTVHRVLSEPASEQVACSGHYPYICLHTCLLGLFRKGLKNRFPKPLKTNSRISTIRLFRKVWVGERIIFESLSN
jgi:hypothetical protein